MHETELPRNQTSFGNSSEMKCTIMLLLTSFLYSSCVPDNEPLSLFKELQSASSDSEELFHICEKIAEKGVTHKGLRLIENKWRSLCREKREDWGGQHISGWAVAKLLGKYGDISSLPALFKGLAHQDDRYRWYSAQAIQKISNQQIVIEDLIIDHDLNDIQQAILIAEKWLKNNHLNAIGKD